LGSLVGWAEKIQDKSGKLTDLHAKCENGWYRSPTVSRLIPATPYLIFIPFTVFSK
jgi:hypothetical protein